MRSNTAIPAEPDTLARDEDSEFQKNVFEVLLDFIQHPEKLAEAANAMEAQRLQQEKLVGDCDPMVPAR